MNTPEVRSSSKPLEVPAPARALDATPAGTSGPGAYQGVDIADFRAARGWQPGDRTLSGTTANRRITATYATLDQGMQAYLGEPMVPNWATFGKFASRTAGDQIIRLEALLRTDRRLDFGSTIGLLTDAVRHPRRNLRLASMLTGGKLSPGALATNARLLRDALVHGNTAIIADIGPPTTCSCAPRPRARTASRRCAPPASAARPATRKASSSRPSRRTPRPRRSPRTSPPTRRS